MHRNKGRFVLSLLVLLAMALTACAAPVAPSAPAADAPTADAPAGQAAAGETGAAVTFPPGKMVVYDYGQPQYWQQFFEMYLKAHPDLAPSVTVEMVQTEGEADARQKVILSYTAGAFEELPDAVATAPVSMKAMAEGGILMDVTEYVESFADRFVPGVLDQLYYKGRIYCLPKDLRPQLLFYNSAIFEKYGIDPAEMETIEGWIEVGRKLKEASNGEVYLSYIEPGARTWRYYGRRGLMPQANAKIWDDEGNVVIDTDPGAQLAFKTLETLQNEGLLYSAVVFDPPLYEATRQDKIATYYIGAFWDEFLRKNVPDMEGKWRVMPAPVFADLGLGGAPVIGMQCLVNKPDAPYAELYKAVWEGFHFDGEIRKEWTNAMVEQDAPYPNPIAKELLADPFWKEPSPFYGGQSFREMEGVGLENVSENLRVTEADAEADEIISAELEKWIAGSQTMDEAIVNIGTQLRERIGQAPAAE